MIIEREKIVNSDIDPINFERPLSQAYLCSKMWSRELPDSVRLSLGGLRAMNRPLKPEAIDQTSRAGVEGDLCRNCVTQSTENVSLRQINKKQLKESIAYRDNIWVWDRALEARSHSHARVHKQPKPIARSADALAAQSVLRNLESMLNEQDESDFLHRPTEYAYNVARLIVADLYTHYLGSSPAPVFAPDGEGGIIAEWKSGQRIVRLIVGASENEKKYVYSKGNDQSLIDHSASGSILAQRLRSIFAS